MSYRVQYKLTFPHPVTGETMDMESAAPDWHYAPWTDKVFEECETSPEDIDRGALDDPAIRPILEAMAEIDTGGSGFTWFGPGESWTWAHTADMKKLSARFPDILFTLEGRGPDQDVWRQYYRGGKFHGVRAGFTIAEFDEALFK